MSLFAMNEEKVLDTLVVDSNDIRYSQDYRVFTGLPVGVPFRVTRTPGGYILRGHGYGEKHAYGDGAIYVAFNCGLEFWINRSAESVRVAEKTVAKVTCEQIIDQVEKGHWKNVFVRAFELAEYALKQHRKAGGDV